MFLTARNRVTDKLKVDNDPETLEVAHWSQKTNSRLQDIGSSRIGNFSAGYVPTRAEMWFLKVTGKEQETHRPTDKFPAKTTTIKLPKAPTGFQKR